MTKFLTAVKVGFLLLKILFGINKRCKIKIISLYWTLKIGLIALSEFSYYQKYDRRAVCCTDCK